MKTISVMAILIALLALAMRVGAEEDYNGLQLSSGINGEPVVAMDILAAFRNDRVQESHWAAKPFVAVGQAAKATGAYAVERPGRFTFATLGTYAGVRMLQGKLGQDIEGLGRAVGLSSSGSGSDRDEEPGDTSDSVTTQQAQDEGLNINVDARNRGSGSTSVELHLHIYRALQSGL